MELGSDRVADLVSAFGTDRLGHSLLDLFEPECGIVHGVAFERDGDEPPRVLFAAATDPGSHALTGDLVRAWTASDYRIDPVLATLGANASREGTVHFCDARELGSTPARERFIERYYRRHGLGEEVDYLARDGARLLVLSLCRHGRFDAREREALASLAPLMLACARQCTQRVSRAPQPSRAWPEARSERLARLRKAFSIAPGRLTAREIDVCSHIVLGCSASAIGLELNISAQTVASHRKHAYAKLGVCSQTELFALWHRAADPAA